MFNCNHKNLEHRVRELEREICELQRMNNIYIFPEKEEDERKITLKLAIQVILKHLGLEFTITPEEITLHTLYGSGEKRK